MEQAAACKRRRSCRQARTEEFAGCCLRRSQSAQGATGKGERTAGANFIRSAKRARRLRSRQQPANTGGRADRHGRRCLQAAACVGAKAHREPRARGNGRHEQTSFGAQNERGDYAAGRRQQRRRSCRQARTEEFAASCLRRSQSVPGATDKRKRREGAHQRQRSKRQRSEPAHRPHSTTGSKVVNPPSAKNRHPNGQSP